MSFARRPGECVRSRRASLQPHGTVVFEVMPCHQTGIPDFCVYGVWGAKIIFCRTTAISRALVRDGLLAGTRIVDVFVSAFGSNSVVTGRLSWDLMHCEKVNREYLKQCRHRCRRMGEEVLKGWSQCKLMTFPQAAAGFLNWRFRPSADTQQWPK